MLGSTAISQPFSTPSPPQAFSPAGAWILNFPLLQEESRSRMAEGQPSSLRARSCAFPDCVPSPPRAVEPLTSLWWARKARSSQGEGVARVQWRLGIPPHRPDLSERRPHVGRSWPVLPSPPRSGLRRVQSSQRLVMMKPKSLPLFFF